MITKIKYDEKRRVILDSTRLVWKLLDVLFEEGIINARTYNKAKQE